MPVAMGESEPMDASERKSMAQPQAEKRSTRRFALRLPVTVKAAGSANGAVQAETRDVSARGVCLCLQHAIDTGTEVEFTLTLPPEITLTDSIRVRCFGRIVRVQSDPVTSATSVGAVIERYEFAGQE
jgi:hypothetical protein